MRIILTLLALLVVLGGNAKAENSWKQDEQIRRMVCAQIYEQAESIANLQHSRFDRLVKEDPEIFIAAYRTPDARRVLKAANDAAKRVCWDVDIGDLQDLVELSTDRGIFEERLAEAAMKNDPTQKIGAPGEKTDRMRCAFIYREWKISASDNSARVIREIREYAHSLKGELKHCWGNRGFHQGRFVKDSLSDYIPEHVNIDGITWIATWESKAYKSDCSPLDDPKSRFYERFAGVPRCEILDLFIDRLEAIKL